MRNLISLCSAACSEFSAWLITCKTSALSTTAVLSDGLDITFQRRVAVSVQSLQCFDVIACNTPATLISAGPVSIDDKIDFECCFSPSAASVHIQSCMHVLRLTLRCPG